LNGALAPGGPVAGIPTDAERRPAVANSSPLWQVPLQGLVSAIARTAHSFCAYGSQRAPESAVAALQDEHGKCLSILMLEHYREEL
jgi:hypothetical protein